ncbi:hypothetical protein RYJ27_05500 [Microbacterium limosum]|uniref:Integral membrane protein n=1 Tax=Microbacterium limosum TaxID=3079935 RepID=A0AAU0MK57_9MICO|nr:hypothetical protein [Microbacterium sp. Y20]WOQ70652.1 hypothetical protein RYJ27_05500 [Microbacterium sp. Y20]
MSVVERPGTGLAPAQALWEATKAVWAELPRVIFLSVIVLCAWLPFVAATVFEALAFLPLCAVPALAATSTMYSALASAVSGGRVTLRRMPRPDAVWVALGVLVVTAAVWVVVAPTGPIAVALWAGVAIGALILPVAAAYGAHRALRGLPALAGALVIVAVRPAVALCILAVGVIAGFGVAATAGALVLVVPAVHAAYSILLCERVVAVVNAGEVR